MNTHDLYVKTPPLRLFFFAAMPGAVSMLASALYQLVDGMLVGKLLGGTPFAALNLAMPFVIINFALADLIGVGSSVPISIDLGRKEDKTTNNTFTCACILIVATSAVVPKSRMNLSCFSVLPAEVGTTVAPIFSSP